MNRQRILEELLTLLEANNIKIRKDALGGRGGGLCILKNEKIFFVDTQASSTDMAVICAEIISQMIDIENIYLKPELREFIETHP